MRSFILAISSFSFAHMGAMDGDSKDTNRFCPSPPPALFAGALDDIPSDDILTGIYPFEIGQEQHIKENSCVSHPSQATRSASLTKDEYATSGDSSDSDSEGSAGEIRVVTPTASVPALPNLHRPSVAPNLKKDLCNGILAEDLFIKCVKDGYKLSVIKQMGNLLKNKIREEKITPEAFNAFSTYHKNYKQWDQIAKDEAVLKYVQSLYETPFTDMPKRTGKRKIDVPELSQQKSNIQQKKKCAYAHTPTDANFFESANILECKKAVGKSQWCPGLFNILERKNINRDTVPLSPGTMISLAHLAKRHLHAFNLHSIVKHLEKNPLLDNDMNTKIIDILRQRAVSHHEITDTKPHSHDQEK